MKSLIVIGAMFFTVSSFAAVEVTDINQLPSDACKIGNISYSDINGTTSEIVEGLEKKADKIGGKYFKVTSLEVTNNSRGTAIVYR